MAPQILRYMPRRFSRLFEPFAGMAAISLAAACEGRAVEYHLNDINAPLIRMLCAAVQTPNALIAAYTSLWQKQFLRKEHTEHFYSVRDAFNAGDATPCNMLYLLARCVKGAVRYSKNGEFNQSPDKRRNGATPQTIARNITQISALLQGKSVFSALDYREMLSKTKPGDIVYMDPPYQGVSRTKDQRYIAGVHYTEFVTALESLEHRGVDYIISYDGACGEKAYGTDLPTSLSCKKILLNAGISTQATLLGKRQTTYESLYVSKGLWGHLPTATRQTSLLGHAI